MWQGGWNGAALYLLPSITRYRAYPRTRAARFTRAYHLWHLASRSRGGALPRAPHAYTLPPTFRHLPTSTLSPLPAARACRTATRRCALALRATYCHACRACICPAPSRKARHLALLPTRAAYFFLPRSPRTTSARLGVAKATAANARLLARRHSALCAARVASSRPASIRRSSRGLKTYHHPSWPSV